MMEVGVINTELPFDSHILLGSGVYLSNQHIHDVMLVDRPLNASIDVSQISSCINDSNKAVDKNNATLLMVT